MAKLLRMMSILAAFWAMLLAFIIIADIVGRELFAAPLPGTVEIVGNSIVAILFLQIPAAIHSNSMLRTTMVYDALGKSGRRIVDVMTIGLGLLFFVGVVLGGWPDMIEGWRILEYEGEGSLRIPVYPVRTAIIALSALTVAVYLGLLWRLITGKTLSGRAAEWDR